MIVLYALGVDIFEDTLKAYSGIAKLLTHRVACRGCRIGTSLTDKQCSMNHTSRREISQTLSRIADGEVLTRRPTLNRYAGGLVS